MTINLPEPIERSLHAAVLGGHFASVDDALTAAARLLLEKLDQEQAAVNKPAPSEGKSAPVQKPIWEEIAEITASVPDEVWEALPTDLSAEHDHYIYGTPQRPDA